MHLSKKMNFIIMESLMLFFFGHHALELYQLFGLGRSCEALSFSFAEQKEIIRAKRTKITQDKKTIIQLVMQSQ